MDYYKLIDGNTIVGVVSSANLCRYQTKHRIMLVCELERAQFVELNGKYYRDEWLRNYDSIPFEVINVKMEKISEEDYNILSEAFETQEMIQNDEPQEEPIEFPPIEEEGEDNSLDFVKQMKITELSRKCQEEIENGFDVILTDNTEHHFSLSTNDQLNLITLSTMIEAGETMIPYHADGELCVFYSVDDIRRVMETATYYKTYHTTYFNSLKNYVASLDDIAQISAVSYGMVIPEDFKSDVYKYLYSI